MQHSRVKQRPTESGFTVIEVLFVVAVLGILSLVFVKYFSVDRTKATAMLTRASQVASGLALFRQDISCYPTALSALYNRPDAANTRCGVDGTTNWKDPYIPRMEFTGGTGGISMSDFIQGADMTLQSIAAGAGTQWVLRVTGVPNAILPKIEEVCNGRSGVAGRCTSTPGAGGAMGSFDLMFDETT